MTEDNLLRTLNPVAGPIEEPTGKPRKAQWLEVPDAALLLGVKNTGVEVEGALALGVLQLKA